MQIRMAKRKTHKSEAKTSYKNGNGGLAELLKELWNAAVAQLVEAREQLGREGLSDG